MSGGTTSGYGSSNKDKVASLFGIQLKPKDSNKQSQSSLSPTTDKKSIETGTSPVTKNKNLSDFRSQNQSNGFQTKTNTINHSSLSKTPEPERKTLENSTKSRSSIALVSLPTSNERRESLTSNVNHSTFLNPVKLNQTLSSKSPESIRRSSLTPISIDEQKSNLFLKDRSKSPEPSSIRRLSITKTPERSLSPAPTIKRISITKEPERSVSPVPNIRRTSVSKTPEPQPSSTSIIKRPSIPTVKTEAQIEHLKDQPLYKRQLSKTLDNATLANKNKHQHEISSTK